MQSQMMRPSDYLNSRAQAVDAVQSTIVELAPSFRISPRWLPCTVPSCNADENLDETLTNTRGLRSAAALHEELTSNGLVMRAFAIVMFFIVLWERLHERAALL